MQKERSRLNQPYFFPGISCGLRRAGASAITGGSPACEELPSCPVWLLSMDEDEFTSCTLPILGENRHPATLCLSSRASLFSQRRIWATRAMRRVCLRHNQRAFGSLPYQLPGSGSDSEKTHRFAHQINRPRNHDHRILAGPFPRTLNRSTYFGNQFDLCSRAPSGLLNFFRRGRSGVVGPRRNHALRQRKQNLSHLRDCLVAHGAKNKNQRLTVIAF